MIQTSKMLQNQQQALTNNSANSELFKKELIKSVVFLNAEDLLELKYWLMDNYSETHKELLSSVFNCVESKI